MTRLRRFVEELVERRLWPVAAVLLVALVAVPVLLTRGAPAKAGPVPGPPAAADVGPTLPAMSESSPVISASSGRGLSRLPRHDPFVQRRARTVAAPSVSSSSSVVNAARPAPTSSSASPSSTPSGDAARSGTPSPPPAPVHPPRSRPRRVYTFWTVDLRFGPTDHTRARPDLARLSPLPSQENPIVIFDGLAKADHRTALFTVSSDATADGDGTCAPDPKSCVQLQLKPGQREFFTVAEPDGTQREYQLDYVRVRSHRTFSRAVALAGVDRRRHPRSRRQHAGPHAVRVACNIPQVRPGTSRHHQCACRRSLP